MHLEVVESDYERVYCLYVKIVRGLVEKQQMRPPARYSGKHHAAPLPACKKKKMSEKGQEMRTIELCKALLRLC